MPITVNKKFKGDHNQNANNEVASFNKIFIDFSGAPIMTLVCASVALVLAAIVFMIVQFGSIMVIMTVVGVSLIGTIGIISSGIALVAWAIRTI